MDYFVISGDMLYQMEHGYKLKTLAREIRSRPAHPAAPPKEYKLTEDIAFIRSKTMNCKGCESNTCAEVCQLWQREHDTAIRNAATLAERERMITEFIKIISAHTIHSNSLKRDDVRDVWILVGGRSSIVDRIHSLRTQQEHP